METGIMMISAVSEVLSLKSKNPGLSNEELLKHVSNMAVNEKSESVKLGMIAAASYALDYKQKNPNSTEKEIIKYIMQNLKSIMNGVG